MREHDKLSQAYMWVLIYQIALKQTITPVWYSGLFTECVIEKHILQQCAVPSSQALHRSFHEGHVALFWNQCSCQQEVTAQEDDEGVCGGCV